LLTGFARPKSDHGVIVDWVFCRATVNRLFAFLRKQIDDLACLTIFISAVDEL
jgi:hypothetical protein